LGHLLIKYQDITHLEEHETVLMRRGSGKSDRLSGPLLNSAHTVGRPNMDEEEGSWYLPQNIKKVWIGIKFKSYIHQKTS
jgi:hypothetical protein